MDHQRIVEDLAACLADGECERAGTYLADLREAVGALPSTARVNGAISLTLAGIERALERNDVKSASTALRHVTWLMSPGASP
jgi:hypothetical protein